MHHSRYRRLLQPAEYSRKSFRGTPASRRCFLSAKDLLQVIFLVAVFGLDAFAFTVGVFLNFSAFSLLSSCATNSVAAGFLCACTMPLHWASFHCCYSSAAADTALCEAGRPGRLALGPREADTGLATATLPTWSEVGTGTGSGAGTISGLSGAGGRNTGRARCGRKAYVEELMSIHFWSDVDLLCLDWYSSLFVFLMGMEHAFAATCVKDTGQSARPSWPKTLSSQR